jgi:hypothetical protein
MRTRSNTCAIRASGGIAQVGLAQVDVEGVVDLVGHGVLTREPAPEVRLIMSPVALHAASAGAVDLGGIA